MYFDVQGLGPSPYPHYRRLIPHNHNQTMRRRTTAQLVVCLAAILPYLSTLGNYFVGDDFGFVKHLAGKPAGHFLSLFTNSWAPASIFGFPLDELRPFPAITYQLGILGGPGATLHHAISIVIHAINALLVAKLAESAARLPVPAATFAGIVFAILPVQVESVAWITGRSELLYGLFCLSSLLAWTVWRRSGARAGYAASMIFLFAALFSKQNAIVMVAMFVLYDAFFARIKATAWSGLHWREYVPPAALVAGYLLLRHLVFSDAIRAGWLSLKTAGHFLLYQAMYLVMLLSGSSVIVRDHFYPAILTAVAAAIPLVLCFAMLSRTSAGNLRASTSQLVFFGPVWWAVTTAPIIVAGYGTTRHLYFTFAGTAIFLSILLNLLWSSPARGARLAGRGVAAALIVFSLIRQTAGVADWNTAARISGQIARDVEREANAASPGTLLLLDAPPVFVKPSSASGEAFGRPYIWSYAVPHAVRPPYASTDLTERVRFVAVTARTHCCTSNQWARDVTSAVKRWAGDPEPRPVRILKWDAGTGALSSLSDSGDGLLGSGVRHLAGMDSPADINNYLGQILGHKLPRVQ